MAASNHTMILALYSARVKFDAVPSFALICTLVINSTVMVTVLAISAKTMSTFMQNVREAPSKLIFGTQGTGSSGHFASEQFLRMTA